MTWLKLWVTEWSSCLLKASLHSSYIYSSVLSTVHSVSDGETLPMIWCFLLRLHSVFHIPFGILQYFWASIQFNEGFKIHNRHVRLNVHRVYELNHQPTLHEKTKNKKQKTKNKKQKTWVHASKNGIDLCNVCAFQIFISEWLKFMCYVLCIYKFNSDTAAVISIGWVL